MAMKSEPDWRRYERLVAAWMAGGLPTDLCVTVNGRVTGIISGRSRQIDVLIDARHDRDVRRRIIVDAKKRKRKIDVTHVEAFRGLMEDVAATHGYIVCPAGHTKAAERRAQERVRICLLPLEHLQSFDPSTWPRCARPKCEGGRVFWDGFPEISLVAKPVDPGLRGAPVTLQYVHRVGKCDRCGRFHVLCQTCQETFSLDDDMGERQCRCRMPWFWLVSVERDDADRRWAELQFVSFKGPVTADRRAI
jgi:hypothetical protein